MSRRTKTLLPTTSNLLKPEVCNGRHSSLIAAQQRQAHYYNQHSNDLEPLQNGDIVRINLPERARNYGNKLLLTKSLVSIPIVLKHLMVHMFATVYIFVNQMRIFLILLFCLQEQ